MRLLNSVCKVIASKYAGVPVHIEEMPKGFERECFFVTLATGGSSLKNRNVYEDDPTYQIVYFGKLNEADQVVAENLYKKKEELKALFLLRLAVPVIPLEGVQAAFSVVKNAPTGTPQPSAFAVVSTSGLIP